MTPADLARRLFREQCSIGPNSTLEAYGETAAVAAMVPLIEALEGMLRAFIPFPREDTEGWREEHEACEAARAALTPQPEEVA